MFEEEGLHSGQYTTWPALVLVNRIVHLLIEVEALCPGWLETWCSIPEKKCF